jgi:tetratricopeptide (TPR) repeat protein
MLAILYSKTKNWQEILNLPDDKEINIFKVIALYNLGKYRELLSFTDQLSRFKAEDKDRILYYRGLSFFKIGEKEKAVKEIEAITFKTPPADGSTITVDYEYETTNSDDPVLYHLTPTTDNIASISIAVYLDGLVYRIAGARGNVTFSLEANQVGKLQFRFQGLYLEPVEQHLSLSCTDSIIPPLVRNTNILIDRYFKPSLSTFEVDMNNNLVQRDDMNADAGVGDIQITSRDPQGNMNPDLVLPSEYNIWAMLKNASRFEVRGQVGDKVGNTVRFAVPNTVMSSLELGERDGVRISNIRFSCTGCDDEFQLFIK